MEPVLQDFELAFSCATREFLNFRCVSFDRLATILRLGIDVEPTDAPIYVGNYEKALEYGGTQKIMLVYQSSYLKTTFREVSTDAPEPELLDLASRFPTRLTAEDGTRYWFSRLPKDHPGISSGYEMEYCRWIPGDPFEALKAIILIGQFLEHEFTQALIQQKASQSASN